MILVVLCWCHCICRFKREVLLERVQMVQWGNFILHSINLVSGTDNFNEHFAKSYY